MQVASAPNIYTYWEKFDIYAYGDQEIEVVIFKKLENVFVEPNLVCNYKFIHLTCIYKVLLC